MLNKKTNIIPSKHTFASKWLVFAIDISIVLGLFALLFLIVDRIIIIDKIVLFVSVFIGYTISELATKLYTIIVRKTAITDIYKCFTTSLLGLIIVAIISLFTVGISILYFELSLLLIIHSLLVISFFILWRLTIRNYFLIQRDNDEGPFYWIYGASTAGILTFNALNPHGTILGFLDDNISIQGKYINGLKVFSFKDAIEQINNSGIDSQVIIAIQNITKTDKVKLVEQCVNENLKVKVVPAIENWIHGELTVGQIKPVKIEDLLGRDEIVLNNKEVLNAIQNKIILVTGAAGSIGSELVNQILQYNAHKIILLDQAETPLFELEQQLFAQNSSTELVYIIADITQNDEIRRVFENNPIDLIFHAAAYKHVPMMENNPLKAVNCNFIGTSIIADLADEFGVQKFVFISTDKAVNPTNVMGATKRAAEIYIQSKNNVSKTSFITTRFGNVLGSNGSVIPQFKKQIELGGPVKVTHPEITRYFMTIPEACQLVIEACAMGEGGEIFIFDMGQSVKIVELAKKMIALSGLTEEKDIEIVFTGLRPGEKLYEELLNDAEITLATHHPKIMKSKTRPYEFTKVEEFILKFKYAISTNESEENMVKILKKLVPEYVSKNSRFEALDIAIIK